MDRIGIFAVAASLVALSALHMLHAPGYWNAAPVALFAFGVLRVALVRETHEPADNAELVGSPTA